MVEKYREYSDSTSAYFSSSKWKNAVEAKATTLNISTQPVRSWRGVHPVSGHTIAGVVVSWKYDQAMAAKALKEIFENNSRNPASSSPNQPSSPTKKGNIIITGDDDDL